MPSNLASELVNGMLNFTIKKNKQLTSSKLIDLGHLYLNGVYRTQKDTTCVFKQQWRHRYRRNGTQERLF